MAKIKVSDEFVQCVVAFCSANQVYHDYFKDIDQFNIRDKDVQKIFSILSGMFLDPNFTPDIIKYFRKYVLQLLSVTIPLEQNKLVNRNIHLQNCFTFSKIIELHPDIRSYALKYFEKYPAPFNKSLLVCPSASKRSKSHVGTKITDLDMVQCCYELLKSFGDFCRTKWHWSEFIETYLNRDNDMVKWICCQCIGIVSGMTEEQLYDLTITFLNEDKANRCEIDYQKIKSNVLSVKQAAFETESHKTSAKDYAQISKYVINVSGIYLPVYCANDNRKQLVEVSSTMSNLRKVALGIAANKALCLVGPVGSGKTVLVEHLAALTGRKLGDSFIKVQLGDQTDSKMLLGTYRCTDIPGEFVWQPGVLTQAVMDGSWLLLEDIDSASMDIASVITALLENGYLTVPGYRDSVPITPGFQLFVTQRLISSLTGYYKKHSNACTLLEKQVLQINVEPLNKEELQEIIEILYPVLKTISSRIVDVFMLFTTGDLHATGKSGRLTSTRDLFKWCHRSIDNYDVSSPNSALKVLQEAIDIFCCSISAVDERLKLAKEISVLLGVVDQKAEYFCNRYKPDISLANDCFKAGRTSIARESSNVNRSVKFCFTRPSSCLLERVVCCVTSQEPVLLVGETGTGKTSSVQFLATTLGQKLIVINMNQQSDSADLLGGFKPVHMKFVVAPLRRQFERVFREYFSLEANKKFLEHIANCFNNSKWTALLKLMKTSYSAAMQRLNKSDVDKVGTKRAVESETSSSTNERDKYFVNSWTEVGVKLSKLEIQLKQQNALAFSFIEGSLVKAVENGYWVLLDEINLANAETLECLSGLLEGADGSLSLLERGDRKPIVRHKKFTLFACMNPSTDVGKKDLPAGLRNRFTEFYVEELTDKIDLMLLVSSYLETMSLSSDKIENIVKFYLNIRKEATRNLSDGLGHKPHFSLRSLCRALMIAGKCPCGNFNRSLYEAFCLSFLTQLDADSYKIVQQMIEKYILGTSKEARSVLKQPIMEPKSAKPNSFIQFEGYWVSCGTLEREVPENYILTESVRRNLKDLVRVVSLDRLPVLLQGDTSVGKTSLIMYLAKSSGNKCVRINNHEHTDLQEYIGSYVADSTGKLVFREGVLVEAMRKGHWIILDELNLAPTDVLEALNRVLDDNRELFIPETQETVQANPNFMLFATQNPPGTYGGRKMLSRAFRNRFVELHFNEIPPVELETIMHERCEMPPSYCKKVIAVMTELQTRRRSTAAFAGKQGFITLRDLFRWGERYRLAKNSYALYDWDQHLADEGYLILAGRVRKIDERNEIAQALSKHLKRQVVPEKLFTLSDDTSTVTKHVLEQIYANRDAHKNIVWTFNMRQLAVLVAKALEFGEPVLLVGETGGGKTTVCKLIAENNGQQLVTVNCHMHTESADFIGGLRPVRDHTGDDINRLFEWVNGPLIDAMQQGHVFLADEISLADDSVLERLNSLLEPEKTLLLAEKGSDLTSNLNSELIVAKDKFHFIGTMNPGGDFGKKELSPALRNRFTEIWCETCTNRNDLIDIVEQNVKSGLSFGNQEDGSTGIGRSIMDFIEWFKCTEIGKRFTISIRDILTWVKFINACADVIGMSAGYMHGACLTFLDSFGSGVTGQENYKRLETYQEECITFLSDQLIKYHLNPPLIDVNKMVVESTDNYFGVSPFYIEIGNAIEAQDFFSFAAPTTLFNALRLLRGLQLNKAILLEGSPGVGKTSLVSALAKVTRNKILRINLSDQTDISDLFGADLPVEGGTGGQFAWRDGPFLQALRMGHWILLDELNLASQSVLEGLNACLDHRGEIYIPELGKTFHVKPGTRLFACQNPLKQGGSRRGLPQSFLNRFTQVYVDSLKENDLQCILEAQFTNVPKVVLGKMIEFNFAIVSELDNHTFGHKGSPWEYNLRDLTRWCEATLFYSTSVVNQSDGTVETKFQPERLMNLIYGDRMRTESDKGKICDIFQTIFGVNVSGDCPLVYVNKSAVFIGDVCLNRDSDVNESVLKQDLSCLVLRSQMLTLRSLTYCVNLNWMAILVGSGGSGKSSVVHTLAHLAGRSLRTLPVTSAMDTTDILGGFEQADYNRHLEETSTKLERLILQIFKKCITANPSKAITVLRMWETAAAMLKKGTATPTMAEETSLFLEKVSKLLKIVDDLTKQIECEDIEHELIALIERLNKLQSNVTKEGSLNAGGKFEWVDSILVKCLQEGCWLLVDNVNLCSPAVLDRLNALLEPNGVLTIGERGVDENGEMIRVKPHPNFRLFLTMDPKNGEISRAMRNRGLEIYMLNENETGKQNPYDLKSLIYHQGLEGHENISALIKVHEFVTSIVLGEKPTLNHILKASFLISQQILRGIRTDEAFTCAVVDVYIKSRTSHDFSIAEPDIAVTSYVNEILQENVTRNDETTFSLDCTLKTNEIQRNSRLEKIKQQLVLVNAIRQTSVEQVLIANELLVNTYTNVSLNELGFKFLCCKELFPSFKAEPFNKLSMTLYNTVTSWTRNDFRSDMVPIDANWLPDAVPRCTDASMANKLFLALCYNARKCVNEKEEDLEFVKTQKSFTILHCSAAVANKKISDTIVNDELLKNFVLLLNVYDNFLTTILTSRNVVLNDEQTFLILSYVQWRFILYELGKTDLLTKLKVQKFNTRNLIVHYKWFLKYSVHAVRKLSGGVVNSTFSMLLEKISADTNVETALSVVGNIAKRFKKTVVKPLPETDEIKLDTLQQLTKYLLTVNIWHSKALMYVINMFTAEESCKASLIDLMVKLVEDGDVEGCYVTTLFEGYQSKYDPIVAKFKQSDLEILPFIEYVTNLAIIRYKSSLSGSYPHNVNSNLLRKSVGTPVDLCALIELFAKNGDERSLMKITSRVTEYLLRSPCVMSELINLDVVKRDDTVNGDKLSMPVRSARLITMVTKILVASPNQTYNVITGNLGNFRDKAVTHRFFNLFLWKNLQAFSSKTYDYDYCDVKYLRESYEKFIKNLMNSLETSYATSDDVAQIKEMCIETIRKTYSGRAKTEELITLINRVEEKATSLQQIDSPSSLTVARCFYCLNYVQFLLNSNIELIDPLTKIALKLQYCQEERKRLEFMKKSFELQNDIFSNDAKSLHPYCGIIEKSINKLKEKEANLSEKFAIRPKDLTYGALKDIVDNIRKLLMDSFAKIDAAIENVENFLTQSTGNDLQTLRVFAMSVQNAANQLMKYRIGFGDIVEPILSTLLNILYGVQLIIDECHGINLKRFYVVSDEKTDFFMNKLLEFPILSSDGKDVVQLCTSPVVATIITTNLQRLEQSNIAKREVFKLFKCGVQEMYNLCVLQFKYTDGLNKQMFLEFDELLFRLNSAWTKQEEDKEILAKESENLYRMVAKCDDLSEEESMKIEMKELFPNYHELDFSDMYNTMLDDDPIDTNPELTNVHGTGVDAITLEDIHFVYELHSQLLQNSTKTEWLAGPKLKPAINYDFVSPLMQRFKLFKVFLNDSAQCMEYAADTRLVGSLNVLVTVAQNCGNVEMLCDSSNNSPTRKGGNTSKRYNFYKDQNVEEIKSCYHIIEELKIRILQLLSEWNEHPTLKTIYTIINRIFDFPITSPVTRYLTGLEILLSKCHEWEENAHSGVSLAEHSAQLTQQIITWRKLELSGWKDSLNIAFERMNYPIAKWWLHLYNLMCDFIVNGKITNDELIKLVQLFVEKSSIAEYNNRLALLYIFHCHATYLPQTEKRDFFLAILWNLHSYYNQFIVNVETKIKDVRAPIEKKLKDFVKIARWNDINYWAIKDAVEKTHRTLHKYIKEFETVLKEVVTSCLTNKTNEKGATEHVGIWDRPQRHSPKTYHYCLEPPNYIAKLSANKKLPSLDYTDPNLGILPKVDQYFGKMRKLCKDTMLSVSYPLLIQSLDTFVIDIIETSGHLQTLEIDTTLTREKQKSQAKHILNQKRLALADLFKSLSKLGLSYKAGLIEAKLRGDSAPEFLLKPIDLEAAMSHLKYDKIDEKLLTIWQGSEMYFVRSIARLATLEGGLVNPSSDLGLPNVERCKGFSHHLMILIQEQKSKLIDTTRLLYYLRYYVTLLNNINDGNGKIVNTEVVDTMQESLKNVLLVVEQFKIVLLSCPEQSQLGAELVDVPILNNDMQNSIQYKFDLNWNNAMSDVQNILSASQKLLSVLETQKNLLPASEYNINYPKYITTPNLLDDMNHLSENLLKLKSTFGSIPMCSGIERIYQELLKTTKLYADQDICTESPIYYDSKLHKFEKNIDSFSKNILIVTQNVYKKYTAAKEETQIAQPEEEQESDRLNEGHLKSLIMNDLFNDIALLDMKLILRNAHNIIGKLGKVEPSDLPNYKPLIQTCLPLLEQLVLFYQYFVTQQVSAYRITCKMNSILLNVFIELATKGFCIAPEFADDLKDDVEGRQSGGVGLGDGKGEKDISDQIENEDQLDDARPEGQEKQKQDDEDCKEESKGIEMSDDFDSKLQDVDKPKDDDESRSDSDDSDAEKQMGDTEEGCNKLDEQIWGSDDEVDEHEDGNDEDKKEEKGGGGEEDGEPEMAAKEEESGVNEDEETNDDNKKKRKDKQKEINEMDEPEFDDDQVDPYHGNQPELPEPEPMDLPDNLQLDDGEEKDHPDEENPFDIDAMKENMPPENAEVEDDDDGKNETPEEAEKTAEDGNDASSEDEAPADEPMGDSEQQEDKQEQRDTTKNEDEEEDNQNKEETDSGLDQKQSTEQQIQPMECDKEQSADNVQSLDDKNKNTNTPNDEVMDENNPDKDGVGQAQIEETSTGHKGQANAEQDSFNAMQEEEKKDKDKRRPGQADSKRSLGDAQDSIKKKLKTVDVPEQEEPEDSGAEDADDTNKEAEIFQHIKDAKKSDTQVLDVATEEQAETQQVSKDEKGNADEATEIEENITEEPEINLDVNVPEQKPEKSESTTKKKSEGKQSQGDVVEEIKEVEIDGETVDTYSVPRGGDSSHHTQFDMLSATQASALSIEEMHQLRMDLQNQLGTWNEPPANIEAEKTWEKITSLTSSLAQDLSEQLRLVLEPTQASRLRGDFRTGRRINMRKVIPYIASQFRKDKIWLRRTKPSKREYQIVLAIDDSSSMADNHSKELAFESIALISKALSLLESGQLGVLSFGEGTEIVHKLNDTFTEKSGVKLLQKFQFQQKKTCVAKLVDFATAMLSNVHTAASNAKLLIVVSDGRGIFSEGETIVHQAVRRARFSDIFMIFVIIDNPESRDSILDIRIPVFSEGKLLGIKPYMDSFPFPFYIILREISTLPSVLSDALRQWFELITNVDKQ